MPNPELILLLSRGIQERFLAARRLEQGNPEILSSGIQERFLETNRERGHTNSNNNNDQLRYNNNNDQLRYVNVMKNFQLCEEFPVVMKDFVMDYDFENRMQLSESPVPLCDICPCPCTGQFGVINSFK